MSRVMKLWHRDNGIYYAVWPENGNTRQKSLKTRDKLQAKRRLQWLKNELRSGKVEPLRKGVSKKLIPFIDEFLEYIEVRSTAGTYECYATALKKAKESWGNIILTDLTPRHIDRLTTDMVQAGLAIPTVNKNYRHVKAAIKKFFEWYKMHEPFKWPPRLPEEEKLRYFSSHDLVKIISQIDDIEFVDLCLLAAYEGLRNSELVRLRFEDIDNPEGYLRITSEQKNKTEARIPINTGGRAVLDRCIQRNKGKAKVFRFKTRQTVSKTFKKAARAAGYPQGRFHDLRHTFGAHLALEGEREATIQKLMRHKSMASTQIYTKLAPDHLRKASEKVNYGPIPLPKS